MIEHLKSLAIFSETVRQKSFRGAARALNLTPSAVSYHVKRLEEQLGTALFYRSTRSVAVTEDGQKLYLASVDMLNAAQRGLFEAGNLQNGLRGRFRMTLVAALSGSFITQHIAAFAKNHPTVDLQLHYDHRSVDLVEEAYDIALRTGKLENSSLTCKRIWEMERVLVASPEFLSNAGPLNTPSDLEQLCWIRFNKMEERRRMAHGSGEKRSIGQGGNVVLNNIEAMIDMAVLGVGLASPPTHSVQNHLKSGRLIEVLPDWKMEPLPVYAIWPPTKVRNPITQAFLNDLPSVS
ncbi:MAG: LysR family transcriptional regulator [Sneathiella sp.]